MTKRGPIPGPVSVYALLDPETGRPRYVGHSKNVVERVAIHWGTRHYAYHLPVRAWLRTLSEPPPYAVLVADVPFERRFEVEATWTERLRAAGEDLLNVSVGARVGVERARRAYAARNRTVSEETRRKIGDAQRGKPKKRGAARKPLSAETRRRMSAAQRGRKLSLEAAANLAEARRRHRERERVESDAAVALAAAGITAPETTVGRASKAVITAQTEAVAQLLTALGSVKPVRASVAGWLGVNHTTAVRRLHAARRLLAERAATVKYEAERGEVNEGE